MATTTPSTPAATSGDGGGCRTTSNNSWQAVTARLAALLEPAGFDIVHALPVQLLLDGQQAAGNSSEADALPTYGRTSTLALLIGNSAALWQPFVAHVARAGGPAAAGAHPLDAYTERHVTAALQQLPIAHHVRFAHHMESGHFFDALRAARVSGLAFVSPVTHLAVHPVFGPWFALRALAVCDVDGADPSSFKPLPCPHPDLEEAAAQRMQQLEAMGGLQNWRQHLREWAALRELGGRRTDPRHTYCPEMLQYHYTKDAAVLARAVDAAAATAAAAAAQPEQDQQQQQQQRKNMLYKTEGGQL